MSASLGAQLPFARIDSDSAPIAGYDGFSAQDKVEAKRSGDPMGVMASGFLSKK